MATLFCFVDFEHSNELRKPVVLPRTLKAATETQTLAATDPQEVGELAQKLHATQTQATTDLKGACKTYDEILAELE